MQGPKVFLGENIWKAAKPGAMASKPQIRPEATRLQTVRVMVEGDGFGAQSRFAQHLGIEVKRWNNFERGSPLPRDVAILLVQKIPGLTTDWLFLGKEDGLSVAVQRKLAEAGKGLISAGAR